MITCHFFLRSTVRIFFFHLRYLRGKRGNERDSAPCDTKKNQKKKHQNISIEPKTVGLKAGEASNQLAATESERERQREKEKKEKKKKKREERVEAEWGGF